MAYTYPVTSVPASAGPTPWQTVGPYFHDALPYAAGSSVVGTSRPGAVTLHGTVYDGEGNALPDAMVEVWQCNAAGRYRHQGDQHPAPLDPNFTGLGRCLTGEDGSFRFVTIKPGAYPWGNHHNAWRPAHIHFSLFGTAFTQRLVTQMYFPGDPLFYQDPIFNAVRDEAARKRMVSSYDHTATSPEWATGYRFDIVLGGAAATPLET